MNRHKLDWEVSGAHASTLLASTSVFAVVEPAELRAACIALCEGGAWRHDRRIGRQLAGAGETIFEQGAFADALYVVESGELEVLVNVRAAEAQARVAVLRPPDIFGEAIVAQERQRSGTVRAIRESVLLVLHEDAVKTLLQQFPVLSTAFLRLMIQRLPELESAVKSGLRSF